MKALWMGIAGAIVVAVIAGIVLTAVQQPSAQKYATENVRLSD
jgi:hypothetical protein